jgi:hypothetical protein
VYGLGIGIDLVALRGYLLVGRGRGQCHRFRVSLCVHALSGVLCFYSHSRPGFEVS